MLQKPIRVLIIDDSQVFREYMSRTLSMDFSTEVVGALSNPNDVFPIIRDRKPNIITLDIDIDSLSYRDYILRLRHDFPHIPIVVISSLSNHVFEALKAGAVDFVAKPSAPSSLDNTAFMKEALNKIKTVYSNAYFAPAPPPQPQPPLAQHSRVAFAQKKRAVTPAPPVPPLSKPAVSLAKRIIAIGASTGGTEAILAVVRNLPPNSPGVVIVQHMPPVFTKMYAERLDKACTMRAREAQNGDRVEQGLILVAEGGHQMRVASDTDGYYVRVGEKEKVSGHCPSVDVLFESVANAAGRHAIGVILTGMGGDGAKNLLKMRETGAYTIGQDEESCVVYGMPMVAYNLGAVKDQLPLDAISGAIIRHLSK